MKKQEQKLAGLLLRLVVGPCSSRQWAFFLAIEL
jgi:hypothetical protein